MPSSDFSSVEHTLRLEQQPLAPTYMAYIYNDPEPGAAMPARSTRTAPYQPASNQTWSTIRMNDCKGVYEHFHVPWNQNNKFLATVRDEDKYAYRDLQRMPPPPFDKSGRSSIRPTSASGVCTSHTQRSRTPSPHRTHATTPMDTTQLMTRTVTQTGAPCFTAAALIEADLEQCAPLPDPEAVGDDTWRRARVLTYEVPPSSVGYGEGGKRPFHQDYSHYKYYGFGGRGAKTSWAYNPKQAETWRATRPSRTKPRPASAGGTLGARAPGQPLTTTEAKLVEKYKQHNYSSEDQARQAEVIEPYMEHVHIVTRQPLSPRQRADKSLRRDKAKVATYRQPVPGELTLAENPSPNHGSQSPFHQRYSHYKLHGFAGQGATSSWARNPKLALLYDP